MCALQAIDSDPVEDLRTVIRRMPGGRLALCAGGLWLRATGSAVRCAVAVATFEIRLASAAASLGLRGLDASRAVALGLAPATALRLAPKARAAAAVAVCRCDRLLQRPAQLTKNLLNQVPFGPTALQVLSGAATLIKEEIKDGIDSIDLDCRQT